MGNVTEHVVALAFGTPVDTVLGAKFFRDEFVDLGGDFECHFITHVMGHRPILTERARHIKPFSEDFASAAGDYNPRPPLKSCNRPDLLTNPNKVAHIQHERSSLSVDIALESDPLGSSPQEITACGALRLKANARLLTEESKSNRACSLKLLLLLRLKAVTIRRRT